MAETRSVYFVTHGSEVGPNGDPRLIEPDLCRIRQLARHLPDSPPAVICGTGQRFAQIAQLLDLTVTRWTPVVGGAEYVEDHTETGQVRMASGHYVPMSAFFGIEDNLDAASKLLFEAAEGTVVIGGRLAVEKFIGCPTGPVIIRFTVSGGKYRGAEILNQEAVTV